MLLRHAPGSPRQAYGDIFAITCIKTVAVFVVISFFYLTGLY